MNFLHNSAIVDALRASALAAPGSPPRRTPARQSCALTRACSTVSSPYSPCVGLLAGARAVPEHEHPAALRDNLALEAGHHGIPQFNILGLAHRGGRDSIALRAARRLG